MQLQYTGYVVRVEWRWVSVVVGTLLLISFAPFIILAAANPPNADWQFMGALHDYRDSAASLSRIAQGLEGNWMVQFLHTPEEHTSILFQPVYPLLGFLGRFTLRSPIVLFHLARMVAGFFMFLALYQLGASIWTKLRSRRVFFTIVVLGSGLGWLYILVAGLEEGQIVPDLMLPQLYPLYSMSVNVHYPLTIAALALLASMMISVLRPGAEEQPSVENEGLYVFLLSVALAFVYPDALLPLGLAYIGSVLTHWFNRRKITSREWHWGLWILVPALPIVTYDLLTLLQNDVVMAWVQQSQERLPTLPLLLLGIGLPGVIALPGLVRAVRHFEADGDRFMLLWLLAMLLTAYSPLPFRQHFLAGLMLPVAYFATRSVEDFWLNYIKRAYRKRLYILGTPLLLLSHVVWLFTPVVPILNEWYSASDAVLDQSYTAAFLWMQDQTQPEDVTLAAPAVATWIPQWVGSSVVYGHPRETMAADEKHAAVRSWFAQRNPDATECMALLRRYDVSYVLVGARERALGANGCTELLRVAASFGTGERMVTIYIVPDTRPAP